MFDSHPYTHESNFVPQLLEIIPSKTLLLLDRGFWNFRFFEQLMAAQSDLVTYLTAPENRDLGVVKATRPKRPKPPLDLSPFPQSQVLTTVTFALSCHQWVIGK